MEIIELDLFGEATKVKARRVAVGGSRNPIVFSDYDSFLEKFSRANAKTTDDCYTPRDVYEAVVDYVGTITDMSDKMVLRPFYPGGDYINAEYPENGVVIDNPPFSMFTKIVRFYTENAIPFFLFGPGLTIFSACKYCTAVIIAEQITFDNGANVPCNFASNLYGDTIVTTAPTLGRAIAGCESQKEKRSLACFNFPDEVLSVSDMQTIARNDVSFSISRQESALVNSLDLHPKKSNLFGAHLLISQTKGKKKEMLKRMVKEKYKPTVPIPFSERERRIISDLGQQGGEG